MTDLKASAGSEERKLIVPASLMPAGAAECHALASSMIAAEGTTLAVEIDGDAPTPNALQLLIATMRSADIRGIELVLGENAAKIISDVEVN